MKTQPMLPPQTTLQSFMKVSLRQGADQESKPTVEDILAQHAVEPFELSGWQKLPKSVEALEAIRKTLGNHALLGVGKKQAKYLQFGPLVQELKLALNGLDALYQQQQQAGYYKVRSFSPTLKRAIIECRTIYSDAFDRGLLLGLGYRYMPPMARIVECSIDERMLSRAEGYPSTTFVLQWR